jgi:hypothetical protein
MTRTTCDLCNKNLDLCYLSRHVLANHVNDMGQAKYRQAFQDAIDNKELVRVEGVFHCFSCRRVYKSPGKAVKHNASCQKKEDHVKMMLSINGPPSTSCSVATQTDFTFNDLQQEK